MLLSRNATHRGDCVEIRIKLSNGSRVIYDGFCDEKINNYLDEDW